MLNRFIRTSAFVLCAALAVPALAQTTQTANRLDEIIETMVKRYSISYVPYRGVCLFDIVGFSLLTPFEQMMQLNSLSYSLNSAQSRLLTKRIGVDFSRTTTGDGFYVWNRELSLDGNVNLYHFMQLALADNAIAHKKTQRNTVPRLRACFHVGSSYEFHQAEGLNPTLYNYIVGDVTVTQSPSFSFSVLTSVTPTTMPGSFATSLVTLPFALLTTTV